MQKEMVEGLGGKPITSLMENPQLEFAASVAHASGASLLHSAGVKILNRSQ
jgi:hypothetical protein